MKRHILYKRVLIFLLTVMTVFPMFAQKTLVDTDPDQIFYHALDLYNNQKFNSAINEFQKYIDEGTDYLLKSRSDYYIAMSAKALSLKNTESLFLNYIENYPEQSKGNEVYLELGKYYFYKKKFEDATKWLIQVNYPKQLGKENMQEYYYMLGYCHFKNENYDKAISAFSKIDEDQGTYYNPANYYKGYIYYKQNKYEEALKRFLRVKGDDKLERIIPVYITHIYLSLKKYQEVLTFGEKAILIPKVEKANDIKAYMAEASFQLKDFEKALVYYQDLQTAGYKFSESDYYNFGYTLFKNQEYKQAIPVFANITIKEDKLGQNIAFLLGTSYLMTNNKSKAKSMFGFASKLKFDVNIQEISTLNNAKLSYDLGYDKEAITELKKFITNFPSSNYIDDAKSLMGLILLNTQNYKDAIQVIESLNSRNTDLEAAYQKVTYYYGLEFFQNKKYTSANDYFIKAIKSNAEKKYTALAYFWLGESYYKLKQIENAQREYKNFLYISEAKKTPYYSIAYYNLGYTYIKTESYSDAKTYFSKFISLENETKKTTRYEDAYIRLADCYFALKDYENALIYYNQVITQSGQETDYALFQKAAIQGLQQKNAEKAETLRQLTTKFPNSPFMDDALFEIAKMHYLAEEYAMAQTKFSYMLQEFPKSPYYTAAMLKVAQCYYNLDKIDKALEVFKNIMNQYPYTSEAKEAFSATSEIYIDRGEGDKVIGLKPGLSKSTQDSVLYYSAFSYIKKSSYEQAIKELDKYLQKFPNGYFVVNANYYLANSASMLSKKDLALEHYENVVQMSPNEFVEKALKAVSEIYYSNMNYEKSIQSFRQLEEIASLKENTLFALLGQMRCNFKLDEFTLCLSFAEKIIDLAYSSQENKTEAQFYQGKSFFSLTKYDQALSSFNLVIDKNAADFGAESKYMIAYIYFLKENYDAAMNNILELKDDYANSEYWVAKGFILLADVFVKMGDYFEAKSTLQSIIDNYSGEDLKKISQTKLEEVIKLEKGIEKTGDTKEEEIELN